MCAYEEFQRKDAVRRVKTELVELKWEELAVGRRSPPAHKPR
jgi:hypothetical protein